MLPSARRLTVTIVRSNRSGLVNPPIPTATASNAMARMVIGLILTLGMAGLPRQDQLTPAVPLYRDSGSGLNFRRLDSKVHDLMHKPEHEIVPRSERKRRADCSSLDQ